MIFKGLEMNFIFNNLFYQTKKAAEQPPVNYIFLKVLSYRAAVNDDDFAVHKTVAVAR